MSVRPQGEPAAGQATSDAPEPSRGPAAEVPPRPLVLAVGALLGLAGCLAGVAAVAAVYLGGCTPWAYLPGLGLLLAGGGMLRAVLRVASWHALQLADGLLVVADATGRAHRWCLVDQGQGAAEAADAPPARDGCRGEESSVSGQSPAGQTEIQAALTAVAPGAASDRPAGEAEPAGREILLVEDDPVTGMAVSLTLGELGYAVRSAIDGREALDYLHGHPRPGLILLDLMMPGMNGWDFRHKQQQDPALADIPVVVVSAVEGSWQDAQGLGAAGWLQKPVELDYLLAAVQRHCTPGPQAVG
jgi:CheY-like chemotaxis protein